MIDVSAQDGTRRGAGSERGGARPGDAARGSSSRAGFSKKGATGRGLAGRKGLASLDSALKDYLRASGIGARLGPWATFRAFQEAAGPTFARRARPVRLVRGELTVEVDSASHLAELKGFLGEDIRNRTNQLLGVEDIRRITFRLQR